MNVRTLPAYVLYVVSNASLGLRVAGACSQSEAYYALSDKCHLTMFSKCLLYSRRYDRKILALVPCRDTSLFKRRRTTQLLKKVVKTFDGTLTLKALLCPIFRRKIHHVYKDDYDKLDIACRVLTSEK